MNTVIEYQFTNLEDVSFSPCPQHRLYCEAVFSEIRPLIVMISLLIFSTVFFISRLCSITILL